MALLGRIGDKVHIFRERGLANERSHHIFESGFRDTNQQNGKKGVLDKSEQTHHLLVKKFKVYIYCP